MSRSYTKTTIIEDLAHLCELVNEELANVESSFQEAEHTLCLIKAQIAQVRRRLRSNLLEDDDLHILREEVRNIKYKIPYNLVYASSSKLTHTHDPNIVYHPRVSNPTAGNTSDMTYMRSPTPQDTEFYFSPPPPHQYHTPILLDQCSSLIRGCLANLAEFPSYCGKVLTKRTLLLNCFLAQSDEDSSSSRRFDDAINNLLTKGLIATIYKTATSTVSSYHTKEFRTKEFRTDDIPKLATIHFSPLPWDKQQVLYSDNRSIIQKKKTLKVLLLGMWHRSLPLSQHIEVADPNLFYNGMEKLTELKFISLRGISMISELPQFITKLKKLQFLDCKSCHDLEVIPNNIKKLWRALTHLDISDCHLLDHMPPTLFDLIHLKVLKGFHVGESGQQRKSCTLRDLTKLSKLNKLHINTSVRGFPNTDQLTDLQMFPSLRNLGISWRACQTQEDGESTTATGDHQQHQLSFHLEKFDLECVPNTVTRAWLNPVVFKGLKKLYITGGKFFDLGQILDKPKDEYAPKGNQWTVETLRLKHLSELKMEWSELHDLFPHLVNFEKVDCPNLTSCPNNNQIWVKSTHPHLEQIILQKECLRDHDGLWLA